jgi:hypothetical protein
MPKAAIAIVLSGLVLAASGSTSAPAMQVVPLSKCVASNLSGDIVDAGWRRCWIDRWGRRQPLVLARPLGPRSLRVGESTPRRGPGRLDLQRRDPAVRADLRAADVGGAELVRGFERRRAVSKTAAVEAMKGDHMAPQGRV